MTDDRYWNSEVGIWDFFLFSHPQSDLFFSDFRILLYALCPLLYALCARNPQRATRLYFRQGLHVSVIFFFQVFGDNMPVKQMDHAIGIVCIGRGVSHHYDGGSFFI